jgi:hypothetical protein
MAKENYGDENKVRVRGGTALRNSSGSFTRNVTRAEPEYVEALKAWRPDISPEDFATRKSAETKLAL